MILDASLNRTLAGFPDRLHNQLPRNLTWGELSRDPRLMRANVAEHRLIRQSIEGGDGQSARRAITAHVLRSGELVLAGLRDLEDRIL